MRSWPCKCAGRISRPRLNRTCLRTMTSSDGGCFIGASSGVRKRRANSVYVQRPASCHAPADGMFFHRPLLVGWLEMDIMLGDWVSALPPRAVVIIKAAAHRARLFVCFSAHSQAAANLQKLDSVKLQQFQEIIDMENPDLFRWLTGQAPIPAEMNNPVLRTLVEDLRGSREPKVSVRSAVGFEGKVWE